MRDGGGESTGSETTYKGIRPSHHQVIFALPKTTEAQVLGKQVLRSGTSVGAHYREACRAKSNADFISKIEGGLQELEETVYWLELLADAKRTARTRIE